MGLSQRRNHHLSDRLGTPRSVRYDGAVRGLLLPIAAGLTVLVFASSVSARVGTTAPSVYVNVNITLTDSKVIVSPKSAPRGADARIIVHNLSKKSRFLAFDYHAVGSGVHGGFERVFKPGAKVVLFLFLDSRGVIPYYSGSTFDRTSAALRGTFIVGAECALCNQDA